MRWARYAVVLLAFLLAVGSVLAQSYRLYNPSGVNVASVPCAGPPYGPCIIPNLNSHLDDTCGGTWKTGHDYFGQRTYLITNNEDINNPYCTGAPGVSVCKTCFTTPGVGCTAEGFTGCADGSSVKWDTVLQFTLSEQPVAGGLVMIGGEGVNCYLNGNLVSSIGTDNNCGVVRVQALPEHIPGSAFGVGTNTLTCSVQGWGTDEDNGFKLSEFYYDARVPISTADYCNTLINRYGEIITSCPNGNYVAAGPPVNLVRCGGGISWPCTTSPFTFRLISWSGLSHEYACADNTNIYECRGNQAAISSTQSDPTGTYRMVGGLNYYCTNSGDWINCGDTGIPMPTGCSPCPGGTGNCDGLAGNGCEVSLSTDVNNCGTCGNACSPNMVCNAGACACGTGFGDCDALPANGCETNMLSNPNNCGSCGNACASGVCKNGVCAEHCFNGIDDDGDGATDQTDTDCDAVIVGTAVEEDGATPIGGVTVLVQGVAAGQTFSYTTTTQSDGSFGLIVAGNVTYTLLFNKTGYAPETVGNVFTPLTQTTDLGPVELEREVGGCTASCVLSGLGVCSAGCTVNPACGFYDDTAKTLCDGKRPGTRVAYNDTSALTCCEGAPMPKGGGAEIVSDQSVISQSIPATHKGQPVHLVVIVVG